MLGCRLLGEGKASCVLWFFCSRVSFRKVFVGGWQVCWIVKKQVWLSEGGLRLKFEKQVHCIDDLQFEVKDKHVYKKVFVIVLRGRGGGVRLSSRMIVYCKYVFLGWPGRTNDQILSYQREIFTKDNIISGDTSITTSQKIPVRKTISSTVIFQGTC